MKTDKLGQEPCFPSQFEEEDSTESGRRFMRKEFNYGMSKRLYIAIMAMQGILAGGSKEYTWDNTTLVKDSFGIADTMLKQEEL